MTVADIHFHEPLQELLRSKKGKHQVWIEFNGHQTIKHLVESLGIPHTEIGQMQLLDEQICFSYLVKNGDRVHVHPATPELDQLSGMFEDGKLTIPAHFILDNHLGKLAADLRMLGFDADYSNHYQDQELAETAVAQARILLTRDRQLLMRNSIRFGYLVRSLDPDEQLPEILHRFDLFTSIQPFRRCMNCNHPLEPVEKIQVEDDLLPLTRKYFSEFSICPGCGNIYWPGSHKEKMEVRLAEILPAELYPG